ncbi:hypothetical protein A4X13_0g9607, partial [Tilletia indica]
MQHPPAQRGAIGQALESPSGGTENRPPEPTARAARPAGIPVPRSDQPPTAGLCHQRSWSPVAGRTRNSAVTASPRFQEEYSAKIPALALLANLGFTYLSPSQALEMRGSKERVVLTPVLRAELAKRRFHSAGVEHRLSEAALNKLVAEIGQPALNEGLQLANQRFSEQLLYGIGVSDFVAGNKVNPTIALIDWTDLDNNSFHFTEELGVGCASGIGQRIPDIVLYVNGLPLAVIEAKRPDASYGKELIKQGISQMLRNQRADEIPQLFAFSQLLLVIDGSSGRYGTIGTTEKFWAAWREEEIGEVAFAELKNRPLDAE